MTPGASRRIRRLMAEAESDDDFADLLEQLMAEGAVLECLELDGWLGVRLEWWLRTEQPVGEA